MNRLPKVQSSANLASACSTSSVRRIRRKSSTSLRKGRMGFMPKAAETDRRKLISAESQRIIAVLDDALLALQITSRFASVCENYEYFEQFLGPEIASIFQHLCTTLNYTIDESAYEPKKSAEVDADFLSSMNKMTSSQKLGMYSTPTMKRIRDVVKTLVRLVYENREVFNAMQMDSKPSPRMLDLIETTEELRQFVFERLQTTEAAEKEHMLFLENSAGREKVLKKQIDELEWELGRVKMDTSQEAEQDTKISMDAKARLNMEYHASMKQYDTMLDKHRQAEINLRKKNFKVSVEVENWIIKYDKDMSEKLMVFETITNEYELEKQKLANLEQKFAPIEQQYKTLMGERFEKEKKDWLGWQKK
uniref:Dynein regulatory complex protein 10 n=1 Tax=Strigamia maritima TaxID=126957 RepID=T1JFX4_STRMM